MYVMHNVLKIRAYVVIVLVFNLPVELILEAVVFGLNIVYSAIYRAGFARQGAREKQLLRENNAFNVSSFVLRAMMSGQYWPEGDEVYHAELTVPILLVHGMHDKFVPVEEDQRMAEVNGGSSRPEHQMEKLLLFIIRINRLCTKNQNSRGKWMFAKNKIDLKKILFKCFLIILRVTIRFHNHNYAI